MKLVEVYGKHGAMKPKIDSEVEEEYDRHRKFLHQTVGQLKKTLAEGSTTHMVANNEMMHGNMNLIEEINKQREANRSLKMKNQTDIARIRQVYQQITAKVMSRMLLEYMPCRLSTPSQPTLPTQFLTPPPPPPPLNPTSPPSHSSSF